MTASYPVSQNNNSVHLNSNTSCSKTNSFLNLTESPTLINPLPSSSDEESSIRLGHHSSASSFDRSDKFVLTEDLSSFESDGAFVSATTASSSDDEMSSFKPLSELRNLFDKSNISSKPEVIVLSDLSDSEALFSSSSSPTCQELCVKIPLHLVKLSAATPPSLSGNHKRKRPLALSHFATIKKRAVNDDTRQDISPQKDDSSPTKSNLSLKLRRSPSGKGWRSLPVDENSVNPPCQVEQPAPAANSSQKPTIETNNHKQIEVVELNDKTDQIATTNSTTTDSEASSLFNSNAKNHLRLNKDICYFEEDGFSPASTSSMTSSNGYIPINNTRLRHNKRPLYSTRQTTHRRVMKSTISFDKVFSFYNPDLTLIDDQLQPANSLSVKNLNIEEIPAGHPVHTWVVGRPVSSSSKDRKRL
jgi:hypothetical protein